MDIELQDKLEKRFPWLTVFIECGDGWYDLIYKMCEEIEQIYKNKDLEIKGDLEIRQIKEKFAELRIYFNSSLSNELSVIIDKYVDLSTTICEECGQPGKLVKKYNYLEILCEDCDKKGGL